MRSVFRVVLVNFLQLGGRDNSAGSGSIVVTGSKVNLRKIFWSNRLSFLFYPKGKTCYEPDLLFSLLGEFLNLT